MRKLAFSVALSLCTFAACAQQASSTQADAAASAIDPADARLAEIEKAHFAGLMQTLGDSTSPRDWALASLIAGAEKERAVALSTRAAAAAPGDALVQWIALAPSDSTSASDDALVRLQTLEADNGSVWMHALMRAAQRHDNVATDAAVRHMAASTYTNEHWYDTQKALIDVFRQHPLPDDYFTIASAHPSEPTMLLANRESAAYVAGIAIVAARAMPAYQTLTATCKPHDGVQPGATRIAECAKIGRMMAAKGSTLIANRIGFALLRVTHTYTDDDVKLARSQDWIWEKSIGLYADTSQSLSAAKLIARTDDQNTTRNELEAMRRELVRENLPTEPPADWIDTRSPFSAERLRADEAALKKKSN